MGDLLIKSLTMMLKPRGVAVVVKQEADDHKYNFNWPVHQRPESIVGAILEVLTGETVTMMLRMHNLQETIYIDAPDTPVAPPLLQKRAALEEQEQGRVVDRVMFFQGARPVTMVTYKKRAAVEELVEDEQKTAKVAESPASPPQFSLVAGWPTEVVEHMEEEEESEADSPVSSTLYTLVDTAAFTEPQLDQDLRELMRRNGYNPPPRTPIVMVLHRLMEKLRERAAE